MNSDNGFLIRRNEKGEYVLQEYHATIPFPPIESPRAQRFGTQDEAVLAFKSIEKAGYEVRHGLCIQADPDAYHQGILPLH